MPTRSEAAAPSLVTTPAREHDQEAAISVSRWLLPAIALGTTLAPLNSSMIAVALPDIRDAYGATVTSSAWLVTLYLLAMAAGQPIGGRLGDVFGRRRVYIAGLVWFGVASVGCAFAPNLLWLVVFRTQQALAGTLSLPNGTAMVREGIPAERRATAFGIVGMAAGIAAASGPPLGGLLVHAFGWAAIFWANVPVITIALVLGWYSLPASKSVRTERHRFDIAGTVLFTAALAALIVIPTLLKADLWLATVAAGVGAISLGFAFVWWERRSAAPVVDVGLFANRHFAAACASVGMGNLVMYTTLLSLPLFIEEVRGKSPQVAGLVLAAMSAFSALLGPLGGRWTERAGRWLPAVVGSSIFALGSLLLVPALLGEGLAVVAMAMAVMGLGMGLGSAPVQTAAVEAAPMERTGAAAGMYSTSRYMGSVLGSTVLAALFTQQATTEEKGRYVVLFGGLAIVAVLAVAANARVAVRHLDRSVAVGSGSVQRGSRDRTAGT